MNPVTQVTPLDRRAICIEFSLVALRKARTYPFPSCFINVHRRRNTAIHQLHDVIGSAVERNMLPGTPLVVGTGFRGLALDRTRCRANSRRIVCIE